MPCLCYSKGTKRKFLNSATLTNLATSPEADVYTPCFPPNAYLHLKLFPQVSSFALSC